MIMFTLYIFPARHYLIILTSYLDDHVSIILHANHQPLNASRSKTVQISITFAVHHLADLLASVLVVLRSRLSYDDSLPGKVLANARAIDHHHYSLSLTYDPSV